MKIFMIILAVAVASSATAVAQSGNRPVGLAVDGDGYVYVAGAGVETGNTAAYTLAVYDDAGVRVAVRSASQPGGAAIPAAVGFDAGSGLAVIAGTGPESSGGRSLVTLAYAKSGLVVSARRPPEAVVFALSQSYPNPITGGRTAHIIYTLPAAEAITLVVVDAAGKTVAELEAGYKEAGEHTASFNPAALPPGSYFYILKGNASSAIRKLAVIR